MSSGNVCRGSLCASDCIISLADSRPLSCDKTADLSCLRRQPLQLTKGATASTATAVALERLEYLPAMPSCAAAGAASAPVTEALALADSGLPCCNAKVCTMPSCEVAEAASVPKTTSSPLPGLGRLPANSGSQAGQAAEAASTGVTASSLQTLVSLLCRALKPAAQNLQLSHP